MNRRRPNHRDRLGPSTTLAQTDVGAYDPPRVQAHRPVKRWEERQDEALGNQNALLNAWQQMSESLGGLLVLTRANAPGDAIGTGTQLIGANGANQRTFPANYQSIAVTNFSGSSMTVAAAPPASQAPSVGAGVYVIPSGCYRMVPLRGTVVTVYGAPGASYDLTAYSKPRPMDFANIGAGAGFSQTATPANPAAGANLSVVLSPTLPVLIQAVQFALTTSATVANRQGALVIGGSTFTSPVLQPASQAGVGYLFAPGVGVTTVNPGPGGTVAFAIPAGIILPPGAAITTAVVALQAGDQISGAAILYQPQPPV